MKNCTRRCALADFISGLRRVSHRNMHDLLLSRSLRYTVLLVICAVTVASLLLGYRGLLELIAGEYRTGGIGLGWGIGAAAAALLLIRYREDLIDG